jgi:hypothetical protein
MDRHDRKPKKDRIDEPDPDLMTHIRSLGLSTVQDYLGWCAQHGFSRRTAKHWRVRLKERSYANRAVAEARLAQKKHEKRQPERIVESIFNGDLQEADVTQPHLKAVCRAFKSAQESRRIRLALHNLLRHVSACSDLVSGQPVIAQFGWQVGNTFVDGLLALARHAASWIRLATVWKPQTHNARRQFSSLARHLFAEWPVPAVMDSVWFLGNSREAVRQQGWFLHVGRGQNIRTADLPLPYTKRMAHHFTQAPADFTVEAALRWGQIHGLGGSERLARAIIGTRLGTDFQNDDFWITVLQFFVANPMLDLAQIGPIIDDIHQQRFMSQDVFVAPGRGRKERPRPAEIHDERPHARVAAAASGGMAPHVGKDGAAESRMASVGDCFLRVHRGGRARRQPEDLEHYRVAQHQGALVAEGRKMKHCVATYSHLCASGACSIWTLEVEDPHCRGPKCGEVDLSSTREKCNMLPGEKHRGILRRWAEQAGLSLAKHV